MKRKIRVYLDTSVISALFDVRNPERKSLTELFFEETENFEIYISEITTVEIARTPDLDLQNKMRKTIATFSMLTKASSGRIYAIKVRNPINFLLEEETW